MTACECELRCGDEGSRDEIERRKPGRAMWRWIQSGFDNERLFEVELRSDGVVDEHVDTEMQQIRRSPDQPIASHMTIVRQRSPYPKPSRSCDIVGALRDRASRCVGPSSR